MSERRPKCVKRFANCGQRQKIAVREPGSSFRPNSASISDPFYDENLQTERLAKFLSLNPTYIRYANMTWFAEEGFSFAHELEAQGATQFLELQGCVYPSLIREFYANFQHKNGEYISLVKGNSAAPLGDCNNDKWSDFDFADMYKSYLRSSHSYVAGELTKAGSLLVEYRLLHYLIAYILVQRNTNHAQPTVNDLKLMFAIREGILVNWSAHILKVMAGIAMSSSRLLAYGIFIFRVIDHLDNDRSDVEKLVMIPREHLVVEFLIHKMSIYKHNNEWMYQEDHRTTVDLDLSDENVNATQGEQILEHQAEASNVPQGPSFGLAHLDAMEQSLNERIDGIMAEFHRQEQLNQNQFEQLTTMLRNMGSFSQPPPDV
ncbi:hypothetical protein Lal_00032156 [Lupinus albus]|nr:hypothetical protein Lal_00032156 [Lupinus albus]